MSNYGELPGRELFFLIRSYADQLLRFAMRLSTNVVIEGELASCTDDEVRVWDDVSGEEHRVPVWTIAEIAPPQVGYYDYATGVPVIRTQPL